MTTETARDATAKKLLLLDGHSLAFRAFYALPAESFSTTDGQHTNAVYGFISMFLTLIEQEKPTHVAAAFDLSGPTFRSEKFPEYKAQRPPFPQEFKGQIELIREALTAMGVVTLDMESYEADDIIATLATRGHEDGFQTFICTGDRDSLQLVTDDVTVLYTLRGVSNLARFTPAAVEEKYGVTPTQYPDLAALRGDTSDNMPGVPGVGPKTAQKWISTYGSLGELIENIDDIGGKVGDSLRSHIDDVVLARDITEMVRDLPLSHSVDELTVRSAQRSEINDLFDKLEFGSSLRQRLFSTLSVSGASASDQSVDDNSPEFTRDYIAPGQLHNWLTSHAAVAPVSISALGVAEPANPDIKLLAFSVLEANQGADGSKKARKRSSSKQKTDEITGPVTGIVAVETLTDSDRKALKEWAENPEITIISHDSKALGHMFLSLGIRISGILHDATLASYLLRPELTSFDLDSLTQRHMSTPLFSSAIEEWDKEWAAKVKKTGEAITYTTARPEGGEAEPLTDGLFSLDDPALQRDGATSSTSAKDADDTNAGTNQTSEGATADSHETQAKASEEKDGVSSARRLSSEETDGPLGDLTWPHWEKAARSSEILFSLIPDLSQRLIQSGLYSIYENMEIPLASILRDMEHVGIEVDSEKLTELKDSNSERVHREVDEARSLVDMPKLNLSSPKQLQEVLFDKLELPKTKKTKTGYSTAAKEIEQLAEKNPHPFLDHLLAHREYQKRMTTVEGLIKAIGSDGRIHTTFKQTVAATGRLSSTEPNLQNIPVRTEEGRRIREVFQPGEGYVAILTADYSQIEMRVMAHLSGDRGLIEAYRTGEDLHNYVGSQVFDVPVDEVTPELRRRVKALSYGLVYGLSEYGLSQQLDIPVREAKHIMTRYFERFGGVKRYLDSVVEQARKVGYTSTMFGRRRYLPDLTSLNRQARENAERAALNAPIQGTAADIIKVAMIRVDQEFERRKLTSRVLLQVHDELLVEIAQGEKDTVKEIVRKEMDEAIELSVPLEVNVGIGENWNAAAHD